MRLLSQDLENAVMLKWEVTPEEKADGLMGFRDLIDQVCEKRIKFASLKVDHPKYLVLGDPMNQEWSGAHEKQLRYNILHAGAIVNEQVLRLFLYHLFRQGHLPDGFYIVHLSA